MSKLLVIDNYDSFTYNLVQMFRQYNLEISVYRSDGITIEHVYRLSPDYILISPGPKDPVHAGISVSLIERFYDKASILGVCLGMQCMNEAFGGKTIRDKIPMHGKTSMVHHEARGLFTGIPSPFSAARYHSLVVETPKGLDENSLMITAHTEDNIIMGLSHVRFPIHGVQFHPESFMTEFGDRIIENFLNSGPLQGGLEKSGSRI